VLAEAAHYLRHATATRGAQLQTLLLQSAAASHPLLALCCGPRAAVGADVVDE
jgi:hypothetical protein